MPLQQALREMPVPVRYAVVGAMVLGVPGAVVGLLLGLETYAPTAWAATIEVGLPSALLGLLVGWVIGLVAQRVQGPSDR